MLLIGAHGTGMLCCLGIITSVVPGPSIMQPQFAVVNFVVFPIYVVCAFLLGIVVNLVVVSRWLSWFRNGQVPTRRDRNLVLRLPLFMMIFQASLWVGSALFFGILYALEDSFYVPRIVLTLLLGAMIVSSSSYLLAEFALRPVAVEALRQYGPTHGRHSLLGRRAFLAWITGTASPVIGMMIIGAFALYRGTYDGRDMGVMVLVVGAFALIFGLLLTFQVASSLLAPVQSLRQGMKTVERGDFTQEIVVFDGSELGELQAGFNTMLRGLRDRDRLKDLFGNHLGQDVAAVLLDSNHRLPVSEREVAVMFIDMVGSTSMADTRPPQEVVAVLNAFFDIVVTEVHRHGGNVNKFLGDAVLAVFGAPKEHPNPCGAALAAARSCLERLEAEWADHRAAVGIAAGLVVAGDIGSIDRYEYTVIGDAVNQAARLSELAKQDDGRALSTQYTVDQADPAERQRWRPHGQTVLRGRSGRTRLAAPTAVLPAPRTHPAQ